MFQKTCFAALALLFQSCFLVAQKDFTANVFTGKVASISDAGLVKSANSSLTIPNFGKNTHTVFVFTRHAEKRLDQGSDPELTPEGTARAQNLAQIFKAVNLTKIYATNYKRTKATAQPTATQKMKTVQVYNEFAPLLTELVASGKGKKYLVVGHSNTVPSMLNFLIGDDKYENLNESEFDNLFVVVASAVGNAKVLAFKY